MAGGGGGGTAGSGTMAQNGGRPAAMRCTYTLFDAAAGLRSAGRCGSFRQDTLLPALTPLYPESTDHNGMPRAGQNRRRCADVDRNRSFSQDWGGCGGHQSLPTIPTCPLPPVLARFDGGGQCWPDPIQQDWGGGRFGVTMTVPGSSISSCTMRHARSAPGVPRRN